MRALTDAEAAELERRKQRWLSGDDKRSLAEFKASLEDLGTPVAPRLIKKAVRKHGHLGLGALNVAASWTLAQHRPVSRRTSPGQRSPRARRVVRRARQHSPPRRSEDDGDPDLAVVPLERFRADVDAWLRGAA